MLKVYMLLDLSGENFTEPHIALGSDDVYRPRLLPEATEALFNGGDLEKIRRIQATMDSATGSWVYVGSGNDLRPYIFSPPSVTHHYVDIVYSSGELASIKESDKDLQKSLVELGLSDEKTIPITVTDEEGNTSSLTVDPDQAALEIHGRYLEESFFPPDISTVVIADLTPTPDPVVLNSLKEGGFLLSFSDAKTRLNLDFLNRFGLSLEDFGILPITEETIDFTNFTEAVKKGDRRHREPTIVFVLQKMRPFTADEAELLSVVLPIQMLKDSPINLIKTTVFPVHTEEAYYQYVVGMLNKTLDNIPSPSSQTRDRIIEVIEAKWDLDSIIERSSQRQLSTVESDILSLYNRCIIST